MREKPDNSDTLQMKAEVCIINLAESYGSRTFSALRIELTYPSSVNLEHLLPYNSSAEVDISNN